MKPADLDQFGVGLSSTQQKQMGKPYAAPLFHFRVPPGQHRKLVPQAERFVYELCSTQGQVEERIVVSADTDFGTLLTQLVGSPSPPPF